MIKYLIKNNFAGVVVVPVWEKSGLEAAVRDLDKKSPEDLKRSLEKIESAIEEEEKERMKKYYV